MSESIAGLLDTNVVVHSLVNDAHSEECRRFLQQVREGHVLVQVDPLVLHEITYAVPKVARHMTPSITADLLDSLLHMRGVVGDTRVLITAVALWKDHPGLGFVDCYLAARSTALHVSVFSKNVRDLRRLGAHVPDPLS